MIRGYSAQQVRDAEAPHLTLGEPLMARASAGLAAVIIGLLEGHGEKSVLLLVGSGNNGGDTLFAGAVLAAGGVDVRFVTASDRVHEEALAAALAAGAHEVDAGDVAREAGSRAVLVDGLLGTGTSSNPALRGAARDIVHGLMPVIAAPDRPLIVAVDIPSGIHPDDGSVPDPTVLTADVTVTFGGYKAGLLLEPARRFAGRVELIDIGLGPDLGKLTALVTVGESD